MQISKLDASKLSQETVIKDLKANITTLQSKLDKLEREHEDLGKKFSSHSVQADSEVKQLQQVGKEYVGNKLGFHLGTCHRLPRGVGARADMGTLSNLYLKDLVFPHRRVLFSSKVPSTMGAGKHPTRPNLGESETVPTERKNFIKIRIGKRLNKSI